MCDGGGDRVKEVAVSVSMEPMGDFGAEAPKRPSHMTAEMERQALVLNDLQDVTQQLEQRLAPVLMAREKVLSDPQAEVREVLVPLADMVRNGTDVMAACVARLRTIVNTLEV